MLTGRPSDPMFQGPHLIGSPVARLKAIKLTGIRYEMNRPAIVNETMALNATVLKMLIKQMSMVMKVQNTTDQKGILVVVPTVLSHLDPGIPRSRAKAKVWREAVARKPIEAHIIRTIIMAVMTDVPALLCVAC